MWFPAKKKQTGEKFTPAGPLSFIHATDLHYISRSLTDNGPAFRFVADHADGKTLLYVTELVQAFLAEVKIKKPEVLILGGDLLGFSAMTIILFTMSQATSGILQGAGKQKIPMITLAAGVVCKIALNTLLVRQPGINIHGAPIASLTCYTVSMIPNLYYS